MKLISINKAEVNMILARNVYDNSGKVLLAEGALLTDYFIERLEQFGINSFYIFDGITDKAQIAGGAPGEAIPASPKPVKEDLLGLETEIDEALKYETMSDVVKMTNNLLDKLMGKMSLPFLTTDMETFQYSNDPPPMNTNMPGNLAIPTDTAGMTSHMTTQADPATVQGHSDDGASCHANSGWAQMDTPLMFQSIIDELHRLEGYYKDSKGFDAPTQFMAAGMIRNLLEACRDLETGYMKGDMAGENTRFEVPYFISSIMMELDKLKTMLPTGVAMNDSAQLDVPNMVGGIQNQLAQLEDSYMVSMRTNLSSGMSSEQKGKDVSSVYQNIIQDLNDLEKMASLIPGTISALPIKPDLLTTTADIRKELNQLQNSYNSYIASAQPINDRTRQEFLQCMNKMIQDLNERKYSLITLAHQVVDEQTKFKMMGMMDNVVMEIKKLENSYMISMHPLINKQSSASGINLTGGMTVSNSNQPSSREMSMSMTTTADTSGPNQLNPRDTNMKTAVVVSNPNQPSPRDMNMTTTTTISNPNSPNSRRISSPTATERINSSQSGSEDIKKTTEPIVSSHDIVNSGITNQDGYTQNEPDQISVDAVSKDQIKNEASKITNSLLDNLTGRIDVNQVADNLANLELNKITHAIMDHLNSKYNSDVNTRNQVKDQAYHITHEAMAGIREGITRNDATRKTLYNIFKEVTSNKHLVHLLVNLRNSNLEAFNHSISVYVLTTMTGMGAGYSRTVLQDLAVSALLHDIGKIAVSNAVLNKRGELSAEEVAELQKHTQYGYDILTHYEGITRIPAMVALQHHERIDGSGYPSGLKERETHQFSRIVALADAYDSLINDKTHGRPKLSYEIIEYIRDFSGKLFDYDYAKLFLQNIEPFPIGSMVLLNTGEKAIVYKIFKDLPARPVVRVVIDKNGELLTQPYDCDFRKDLTFFIHQVLTA